MLLVYSPLVNVSVITNISTGCLRARPRFWELEELDQEHLLGCPGGLWSGTGFLEWVQPVVCVSLVVPVSFRQQSPLDT